MPTSKPEPTPRLGPTLGLGQAPDQIPDPNAGAGLGLGAGVCGGGVVAVGAGVGCGVGAGVGVGGCVSGWALESVRWCRFAGVGAGVGVRVCAFVGACVGVGVGVIVVSSVWWELELLCRGLGWTVLCAVRFGCFMCCVSDGGRGVLQMCWGDGRCERTGVVDVCAAYVE